MKLDILVLAAHPDDAELGCSGTILSHIEKGYKVGIVDFTQGELGTRGSAELRIIESDNSSKILGLSIRENLMFRDGFFENDEAHQLKLIEIIRKYQPDIVLANTPNDRHPDHGKGAKLATDSCFLAGLPKIKTYLPDGTLQPHWRPKNLFHYIQDMDHTPDFVVDITKFWSKKVDSIKAFKSQFYDPESNETPSYISSLDFFNFLEGRARNMGHPAGFTFGEGFLKSRNFGINDLFSVI
ncbi:MAG: bacillithiol biosynthesis deacetylase BshB1 [Bacteroidota bacterium]